MNALNYTINNERTYTVFGDHNTIVSLAAILKKVAGIRDSVRIVSSDQVINLIQETRLPEHIR